MQPAEIYSGLTAIFRDIFDDESIVLKPTTTVNDIADWDSLNHINIIVAAETKFGVKFKTAEIESLQTIETLAGLIESKLHQKSQ
jgi:acyl carrier protein